MRRRGCAARVARTIGQGVRLMPIYMKFTKSDGHDITGDATDAGHEDWIELQSVQLGVPRRGPGAQTEAPKVKEIVLAKEQDSASTKLFRQSLRDEAAKVQIDFVNTDRDNPTVYRSFTLEGAKVVSFQISGARSDINLKAMEFLTLSFETFSYDPKKAGRLVPGGKTGP
jgi:type VI secretion system Hcp family effector